MLIEALIAAGTLMFPSWAVIRARKTRYPLMLQWGRFVNARPGQKGHAHFADEPDVVQYEDFKWWLRLKPNPGINLPLIGYWSKGNGRRR